MASENGEERVMIFSGWNSRRAGMVLLVLEGEWSGKSGDPKKLNISTKMPLGSKQISLSKRERKVSAYDQKSAQLR